jgi:hypothetical protein
MTVKRGLLLQKKIKVFESKVLKKVYSTKSAEISGKIWQDKGMSTTPCMHVGEQKRSSTHS